MACPYPTQQGHKIKYVFFWGEKQTSPSCVNKGCFSQWYPACFEVDGQQFVTAEQYMMYSKAKLFDDMESCQKILATSSPRDAKQLGRHVRGFDEKIWCQHRFDIVVRGNLAKFSQNPALQRFLIETGDHMLVEASPLDRIWGIGLAEDHEHIQNPLQWRGLNLLGFALMQVREKLVEKMVL